MGERYDDPWDFTVTWAPERGRLPYAVQHLFRHRSDTLPGMCVHHTDKGHATYYVRAVRAFLSKYHPERTDIVATSAITPTQPGAPRTETANERKTDGE